MDLNPVFSSTMFRLATTGGDLALFTRAGTALITADPSIPENFTAVSRVADHDSAMNLIVESDVLTRGLLAGNSAENDGDGAGPNQAGLSGQA
jgi:hypothetical protein